MRFRFNRQKFELRESKFGDKRKTQKRRLCDAEKNENLFVAVALKVGSLA
jgi:hypothetical protein